MTEQKIKYSIILPTLNSVKYLPTCVETIISQDYSDYELIISNNCSDDGTAEYLETLRSNSQVKIIRPEKRLPLGEHWDFAISHAQGEWVYGIGSDDGVLPYFFILLDILTDIADKKNLNIIKSNRVYYFWDGVQDVYGNVYIDYYANPHIDIKSTKRILHEVLYEAPDKFFDIPQMYTTSVFRITILEKARKNKTSKIIQDNITQDIYLGLLACLCEDKYLYCNIPIGWVGTSSTKTHGLVFDRKANLADFKKLLKKHNKVVEYYENFMYHYTSYTFGINSLYIANAIQIFKKFDYTDIKLPHEFDLQFQENLLNLFCVVYKNIQKMDENNKKRKLVFFNDLLYYYNFDEEELTQFYNKKICTQKFKFVITFFKKFIHKLVRVLHRRNKTFYLYQSFDSKSRFQTMQDVNTFILNNQDMNNILKNIR